MHRSRSAKRFKRILKDDPNACLVQTDAGLWKIHKNLFSQLLGLGCFVRFSSQVASVAEGFTVIISEHGFHAERLDKGELTPSIFTNSQQIEQQFIYRTDGPPVDSLSRERTAALQYGLVLMFSRT